MSTKTGYKKPPISLSRVSNYSPDLVDRSKKTKLTPFILHDAINHWQAVNKWNPDFFRDNYGDVEVSATLNLPEHSTPYLYEEQPGQVKKMKLSNFIHLMNENSSCYAAENSIEMLHSLNEDYNVNDLIPPTEQKKSILKNIWIGKNTRSGLHFDYNDNFLVQLYGTKKVFLIPPKDACFTYPLPENYTKTQVNLLDPDFQKFPKLQRATIYEGEIKAGDALFIPKGWYHYIYSPNQSVSLNCWYGDNLTLPRMMIAFYRSGMATWLEFIKGFFLYGIFRKHFPGRVFSSFHMGKLAYDYLGKKLKSLKRW